MPMFMGDTDAYKQPSIPALSLSLLLHLPVLDDRSMVLLVSMPMSMPVSIPWMSPALSNHQLRPSTQCNPVIIRILKVKLTINAAPSCLYVLASFPTNSDYQGNSLPRSVEDEEPHACSESLCHSAVKERDWVWVEA